MVYGGEWRRKCTLLDFDRLGIMYVYIYILTCYPPPQKTNVLSIWNVCDMEKNSWILRFPLVSYFSFNGVYKRIYIQESCLHNHSSSIPRFSFNLGFDFQRRPYKGTLHPRPEFQCSKISFSLEN